MKPAPSRLSRRSMLAKLGAASAVLAVGITAGMAPSLAFADAPAAIPQTAKVEVMVLHGTNVTDKAGTIDKRVDEGKPQAPAENLPSRKLTKPPLSSYNNYVLKDRQKVQLVKGTPQHVALPNGRTLELSLVNVALVQVGDHSEKRYTVAASISPVSGDRYSKLIEFTASMNQSMFVGGIAFPTGSLVVAFTVESS